MLRVDFLNRNLFRYAVGGMVHRFTLRKPVRLPTIGDRVHIVQVIVANGNNVLLDERCPVCGAVICLCAANRCNRIEIFGSELGITDIEQARLYLYRHTDAMTLFKCRGNNGGVFRRVVCSTCGRFKDADGHAEQICLAATWFAAVRPQHLFRYSRTARYHAGQFDAFCEICGAANRHRTEQCNSVELPLHLAIMADEPLPYDVDVQTDVTHDDSVHLSMV